MRLGAVALPLVFLLVPLRAQECPAIAGVVPNATLSGTLDDGNCRLTDGSAYMPYRLDLPVRGQIKIDLSGMQTNLSLILRDASGARVDSGTSIRRPIEAGNYVLLVNGQTAADLGPYAITTAFTAEAGMLCSNFPNIGPRQTVTGTMGSSGCLAPDGTAYEAYALNTDGAGLLTVTAESTDFGPVVTLRSSDGRMVNSSVAGTLSAMVDGGSQYTLVVATGDKGGAYRITTEFQSGVDETCRPQKTLTDSTVEKGAIGAASCYVTLPGSGDQLYYNYYGLVLPAAGLVDVTASSQDFTATVNVQDANGNVLFSDSGGGGNDPTNGVQSNLRVPLPAGTYRLQVFSGLPSGGNYALQYVFTPGNPQPCVPTAATPGDLWTGGLRAPGCRTGAGLADLYSIATPAAGTLDLDVSSFDFNPRLVLRDSKDNLIARNDDVAGVSPAHISADLPAGTYTAVAAAASGAGMYRAATKFTAHEIPACTFAPALDLNGGYIQRLGPNSCRGANGQAVDYYTFTLSTDSLVLAVMTSSEADGHLTLYDAAGNVLRWDDNSYGLSDPLIVQYLPPGTYKLGARDVSSGAGGLYEVDLRTVSGARPAFCGSRGPLSPGGSVTGNITYTGCQYGDGTFADLYTLTVASDSSLELRLSSSEFDAYLILLDAKGNVIDEDDDSGGGTNSRITLPLAAGTYYVVAKSFGDYTKHGTYSLAARTVN